MYLLGVDIGTSGCKVTVLDGNGKVRASSFTPYRTLFRNGRAEQNPEDWYRAFTEGVKEVLSRSGLRREDIAAIGIDGMMNSLVLLDRRGKPLGRSIIWMDRRSFPQAERLRSELGDRGPNGPITSTSLLAKIMWVKENDPGIWRRTHKVLLPKDYVRYRLTGVICTDHSDASGTQLFEVGGLRWSEELCEALGIERSKLPPSVPSWEVTGRAKERFLQGVPVVAGCSDAAADNLAAGVVEPNDSLIRLGTCGALFVVTDAPSPGSPSPFYLLAHCVPSRWMAHALTPAGLSVDWFRRALLRGSLAELERVARRAPIGSDGLLFYPYLTGEHTPRTDSRLTGGFVGIMPLHTRAHLARAVLEGVGFSIRECLDLLTRSLSLSPGTVRAAGGGTRSPLWGRILADILGVELVIPVEVDASFGAGMLGGIGVGLFEGPVEAVRRCVAVGRRIRPRREVHRKYAAIYTRYRTVLDKLQEGGGGASSAPQEAGPFRDCG